MPIKNTPRVILLNKPFQLLCQFSEHEGKDTLSKHLDIPNIYPAGRLDFDSEGLLLLTDDGLLQSLITQPRNKLPKTYWAQLEGNIDPQAISTLRKGVTLKDGKTLPATAKEIPHPDIWDRDPPIRERKNITTSWIELTIHEGKNRQVRRMTAAVGYPTLRLIRISIGPWHLRDLQPGQWSEACLPTNLSKKLEFLSAKKKSNSRRDTNTNATLTNRRSHSKKHHKKSKKL